MRASISFAAACFAAVALAQSSESSTSISIPPYSNPNTAYLTETNSLGVITGGPTPQTAVTSQPSVVTSQPSVITSQPLVATIPAGLPTGFYTAIQPNNSTIVASIGTDTTSIVTPTPSSSSKTGAAASTTGSESASGTQTGAAASSSTGAAAIIKVASGAFVGAGAIFAAFL